MYSIKATLSNENENIFSSYKLLDVIIMNIHRKLIGKISLKKVFFFSAEIKKKYANLFFQL